MSICVNMHQTINNNTKVKNIIQVLTEWSKKPTLQHEIGELIEYYHSTLNSNVNFAEGAMVIQAASIIFEKQVDLLHKELFALTMRLNNESRPLEVEKRDEQIPSTNKIEVQLHTKPREKQNDLISSSTTLNATNTEEIKLNKQKIKKTYEKKKTNEEKDSEKRMLIPGLPNEILEKLNVTDCEIDEIINECINQLGKTHPLYSVFAKVGDRAGRTRNVITVNDISLTGKSWNALYILEYLLKKCKSENNENIKIQENLVTTDSTIAENNITNVSTEINENRISLQSLNESTENCLSNAQLTQNEVTNTSSMCESNNNTEIRNNSVEVTNKEQDSAFYDIDSCSLNSVNENNIEVENSALISDSINGSDNKCSSVEGTITEKDTSDKTLVQERLTDAELRARIIAKCKITVKEVRINLLRIPNYLLLKYESFKLSGEYYTTKNRPTKVSKINDKLKIVTQKRHREMEKECSRLVKKLKSFNLEEFELFCYSHNVKEGLCPPIPEQVFCSRKSIDNRSEMSYGYPVTPDSGRYSMTLHTDSELEHMDVEMDIDTDHNRVLSRADSGYCPLTPVDSTLPFSEEITFESQNNEDPTLDKLRNLFPNSFSDPQRTELLRNMIQPSEKPQECERLTYLQKIIDNHPNIQPDFDMYEYGTDILNTFPNKTKGEVIHFGQVVQNKSASEMSRYFVSAMHLAGTENIEILQIQKKKVEGFDLKFLTDERPHGDIFQMPTENQFVENIRYTTSTSMQNHSTPRRSEPTPTTSGRSLKRRRIDST